MKRKLLSISIIVLSGVSLCGQRLTKKKLPLEVSIAAGVEHTNFRKVNARLQAHDLSKQRAFL